MKADVSVVIPVYNGAAFLEETIESALAQTFAAKEIVVVDDGSTDQSAGLARRFEPHVSVVCTPNRGVAAARNTGAALCTGAVLAFLDADDVWFPRKLEVQVGHLVDDAHGLVHCAIVEIDATGQSLRERLDGKAGQVLRDLVLFEEPVILGGGSGAIFDAALFHAVGGYDERLSTSADWDLFIRVAASASVGFVAEPLMAYRLHGSNMHRNVDALERDAALVVAKAFDQNHDLADIRRRAYGNLHYTVGGAYLNIGRWRPGLRHLARATSLRPAATLVRVGRALARRMR